MHGTHRKKQRHLLNQHNDLFLESLNHQNVTNINIPNKRGKIIPSKYFLLTA